MCRVDKINCKGEVFLEPHNPYYTEGESFPFDKDGPLPLKGTSLNLVVERITQGKVFLERGSGSITDKYLKSGKEYEFVIAGIERGMDDEEYFRFR